MNWLSTSAKGWRFRRTGELIQKGDLMPDGPVWQPVEDWMVGGKVLGARDVGDEGEYIITPRKRLHPNAKKQRTTLIP